MKDVQFDYSMLLGLMRAKKISQAMLAKAVGFSEFSMWAKLTGRSYFTQPEIARICQTLGISDDLISAYFFKVKL